MEQTQTPAGDWRDTRSDKGADGEPDQTLAGRRFVVSDASLPRRHWGVVLLARSYPKRFVLSCATNSASALRLTASCATSPPSPTTGRPATVGQIAKMAALQHTLLGIVY